MSDSNDHEQETEILLAVFANQSENIENVKRHTFNALVFFSGINAFVYAHSEIVDNILILISLIFGAFLCILVVIENYENIKRRRIILKYAHEKLRLSNIAGQQVDTNLKNKGITDFLIPVASIFYVFIVLIIVVCRTKLIHAAPFACLPC